MDKYTRLKERLFFNIWIIDRAVNRIVVDYISNINNTNIEFSEGLMYLLKEERKNLLVEYSNIIGNMGEFNREYTKYANNKEGRV